MNFLKVHVTRMLSLGAIAAFLITPAVAQQEVNPDIFEAAGEVHSQPVKMTKQVLQTRVHRKADLKSSSTLTQKRLSAREVARARDVKLIRAARN